MVVVVDFILKEIIPVALREINSDEVPPRESDVSDVTQRWCRYVHLELLKFS